MLEFHYTSTESEALRRAEQVHERLMEAWWLRTQAQVEYADAVLVSIILFLLMNEKHSHSKRIWGRTLWTVGFFSHFKEEIGFPEDIA